MRACGLSRPRSKGVAADAKLGRNKRPDDVDGRQPPRRKDQTAHQTAAFPRACAIRAGTHRGPTAGLAPGNVQGNLAILPQALAADFLRFCQLNPKPCPLIGTSAPGDPRLPALGEDLDIRTDLPRYRVWQDGELVAEPTGCARILARRSGQLRHRLLVFVRGSADGGRHRAAPYRVRLQRADVPHPIAANGRAPSSGRWWSRCGR